MLSCIITPTKLTWWKRVPEEHEGLVRNQESGPNIVAVEPGSIPGGCTNL